MVAVRKDYAAPTGLMSLAHRMGEGGRRPGEGFVLRFYKDAAPTALRQVADDEAASGAPEHSLSGNAQTSRRRLAMTWQAVGEISMPIPRADFQGDGGQFSCSCLSR